MSEQQPRAAVVVTGDEILRGAVADVNGAFLANDLAIAGVSVERVAILPDDRQAIRDSVSAALACGFELIITTGGLGGTHDDVTMEAVAEACGRGLDIRFDALTLVREGYADVNTDGISARTIEAFERKQATLPEGATIIPPAGTAPGCALAHRESVVVVLPGPPSEVTEMWARARSLEPLASVVARAGRRPRRVLRLHSVVEGQFMDVMTDLPVEVLDAVDIGVCARDGELEVALSAVAAADLEPIEQALRGRFGELLYSTDGSGVAESLVRLLGARGETVAVAESCTGGGLGALLTSAPGASAVFLGGVIAYGNGVKEAALGVSPDVIVQHGAVSGPAAEAMADGVRRVAGSDWGVSITGIAGPGGGSPGKPVGLVYVGLAGPDHLAVHEWRFRGVRAQVRARAATRAAHALRLAVASHDEVLSGAL